MSKIVCTLVTSVIIHQRSAWSWQAQEPDAPARRPIRTSSFRSSFSLFPRAAKCDVIQVGNRDPNCQYVGCRLLLSSNQKQRARASPGASLFFHQLRACGLLFWEHTALAVWYGGLCGSLADRRPRPVQLDTHCPTVPSVRHRLSGLHMLVTLTQRHKSSAGYGHCWNGSQRDGSPR